MQRDNPRQEYQQRTDKFRKTEERQGQQRNREWIERIETVDLNDEMNTKEWKSKDNVSTSRDIF